MKLTRHRYNLRCDGCGQYLDTEWFSDNTVLRFIAREAMWLHHNGKDYCPACYSEGENGAVTIKERTTPCNNKPS